MNAHSTQKNRYFDNEKSHTIFTPPPVCNWLKEVLEPELKNVEIIFDPAVGSGNLLAPFGNEYTKMGCDIVDFGADLDSSFVDDFLSWRGTYPEIDLFLGNPPYNHNKESRQKHGKNSLLPEMFAEKGFELFGRDLRMVLFAPMGMRLNTRCYTKKQGDRYRSIRDNFGDITSIVTLPLDLFPNPNFDPSLPEIRRNPKRFKKEFPDLNESDPEVKANRKKYFLESNIKRVETHQEILFFNMPKLKPHYFLPDKVLEELRIMDKELWED